MNMFIIALILVLGFIIGNIFMLKYMDKKAMRKTEEQDKKDPLDKE